MSAEIAETQEKTAVADETEAAKSAATTAEETATDTSTDEATETATDAEEGTSEKDAGFAEQVKRIALAAAEAVSISPEDVKGFVSKLVEKGELAQKDGKRIVQDLGERLKKVVKEPASTAQKAREKAEDALRSLAGRLGRREKGDEAEKAEKAEKADAASDGETTEAAAGVQALADRINASIERVLSAMHIASASEIRSLREKIDALDAKIEKVLER